MLLAQDRLRPLHGGGQGCAPASPRRWLARRYGWLLLFPVGYGASIEYWGTLALPALALTILWAVSLALVLRSRPSSVVDLAIWTIIPLLVVGYYLKMTMVIVLIEQSQYTVLGATLGERLYMFLDRELMLSAFEISTYGFAAAAASSFFLSSRGQETLQSIARHRREHVTTNRRLTGALVSGFLLSVATMALQSYFGIGVAGAQSENVLPFRLAGVIQSIRFVVLPLWLYAIIALAERGGQRRHSVAATVLLMGHALASAILTTSKAPPIYALVGLVVVWLVLGKLSARRLQVLVPLVPMLVLFNGVLSTARTLRAVDAVDALTGVALAASDLLDQPIGDTMWQMSLSLLMRVNGIDALVYIVDYRPSFDLERIWAVVFLAPSGGVTAQYADEVFGGRFIGTGFSPSLQGFFYFVSGSAVVVAIGIAAHVVAWQVLMRRLARVDLVTWPAILALTCTTLAQMTSEGTLEALPVQVLTVAVAGAFVEIAARWAAEGDRGARAVPGRGIAAWRPGRGAEVAFRRAP